jgi:hypothetical protein
MRQRLDHLDRQQKQLLLDLCLRREQLRIGERAQLFQKAAQFFQARLDLTPEPYESAEKFVLQLAGAIAERQNPEAPVAPGNGPMARTPGKRV